MHPTTLTRDPASKANPSLAVRWAMALALLTLIVCSFRLVSFAHALTLPEPPAVLTDRDFANYWMAGRLVLSGEQQQLFAHDAYFPRLQEMFGPGYPPHNWSYPPHFLLLLWPLGLLSYKAALVAFLGLTSAMFALAVASFRRTFAPESGRAVLLLAVAAYALIQTLSTQNGFFTAAAFLSGLVWMKRRPMLAGLAFACLTVKPQVGFLLPLLLLFDRNWRCIAWSAAFTLLLVILSLALFGAESWSAYLSETLGYQRSVMTDWTGDFLKMMPTAFGSIRALGYPTAWAFAVQWPVSVASGALLLWILWKEADPLRRIFALACATFLITPYAFDYDMGALSAIAAMLLTTERSRRHRLDVMALTLTAMLAGIVAVLGRGGIPIAPLILALALVVVAVRAARGQPRKSDGAESVAVATRAPVS